LRRTKLVNSIALALGATVVSNSAVAQLEEIVVTEFRQLPARA